MLGRVTQRHLGELAMLYFLTWVFTTRELALYLFTILYIYVLYTFLHVLYLRFFKTIRKKSWRQSGCFITQGIRRQIWSLYIREYDARVELSLFTIIETWKVLKNKVEQEKKQRFIAQCYI